MGSSMKSFIAAREAHQPVRHGRYTKQCPRTDEDRAKRENRVTGSQKEQPR